MAEPRGANGEERVEPAHVTDAPTTVELGSRPAGRISVFQRIPGIGTDLGLGSNNLMVFWAMFFNEASIGFYQTLAPIYIESLGASPGIVGLVIGIQGLVRLLFIAPAGMIADRVSLRRLIVVGRSLTIAGLILYGLAPTWWLLFPAILVMSIGNVAWPAISKVIADSSEDEAGRTRAFTLIYTVAPSTALLLSPSLGGILAEEVSLRSIFFAGAITQGIAVLFFARLRPAEAMGADDERSAGYRTVLTYRPIVIICGLFLFLLLVLTTGFTLVPNYLESVHDIGLGTIGRYGSVFALGSIIVGIIVSRVKVFNRPMNALILTTLLCPISFLLFITGDSVWVFAMAYFARAGYLVSWGLVYAVLGEVTPGRLRSRAFALAELLGGLGFGIAPFIAGALYEIEPALPIVIALVATIPLVVTIIAARQYVHRLQLASVGSG